MKTLLLTGGAGFIGSNFVELAVQRGNRVIILDAMTYAGHRENLDTIAQRTASHPGSWELVIGDIRDSRLVSELLAKHQCSALLNFAAESHVDRSITGPSAFIDTNILGTYQLLQSARGYVDAMPAGSPLKASFRYLQVSTDEVYGALGDTGKFSEATPYSPNSPYSASKAAADHLVRAWHHTYGLNVVTTNCSNNYGPKQFPEKLIPHMIQCALSGRPLPVYGQGANIRDWIYVKDHCEGILLALEKGKAGETYCFGGNSERKNLEVVRAICAVLDELRPRKDGKSYQEQISFVQDRAGHDWRYAIDDRKAQNELGFTRSMKNFEQGLRSTIEWYLSHEAWVKAVLKS
ncbi:MAG: dTDP-glucose 4,6-dehydratase [Bdellovibrionales bacterium]|nr:dTDP-glucose 4,6-dehydratase [Bdellovibrionales bacterium]